MSIFLIIAGSVVTFLSLIYVISGIACLKDAKTFYELEDKLDKNGQEIPPEKLRQMIISTVYKGLIFLVCGLSLVTLGIILVTKGL